MRCVAFTLAILFATSALAENRPLEKARRRLERYKYDGLLELLADAIEVAANDDEVIEAHRLMAVYHVTFDHVELAIEAFEEILRRDPTWELSGDASPKLREALEHARANRAANATVDEPPTPKRNVSAAAVAPENAVPTASARPNQGSWSRYWWVWTGAGVLLVGAAVGAWAVSRSEAPDTDLGPYPLGP